MAASWPQPLPQPLQLPPAHGALLGDAIGTLGEDVKLAVLGQQLDLDARRAPPARACPARCFSNRVRRPLGVPTRYCTGGSLPRISASTASVGMPRSITQTRRALPYCCSILREEHPQRRAVRGVAGQHLVGQRQAVRRDHQRDHHLRAVRPLVAAVAVAALVALRHVRGVDLEVGAGQIVEQHVEVDVEQVAPALHQMREQRVLVLQQQVMAGIELVRLGQTEVAPSRSAMALLPNHSRCSFHSLPGAISR